MRASEVLAVAVSLLAVASGISGALYFLLKSGYRLGRDVESNKTRLLSLEQRLEEVEGRLECETKFKRRDTPLRRAAERETSEGMEF